jgi:DNA polymerase-3 subunit delta'
MQGKKPTNGFVANDFIDEFRALYERTGGYFSAQQWYDSLDLGKTLKGAIAVREAEEMIRKLSFKSFTSKYKTMLIWLPETMNERAANMILKILEEPWEDTIFILVAEQPDKILGTILSRTQEVTVPRLSAEDLMEEIRTVSRRALEHALDAGLDLNSVKGRVKDEIAKFLFGRTRRRPMVLPVIVEV